MLWPSEYHLQCPHTSCPYHRLRLCHSYAPVPINYQECGFVTRFEVIFKRPLSTVHLATEESHG